MDLALVGLAILQESLFAVDLDLGLEVGRRVEVLAVLAAALVLEREIKRMMIKVDLSRMRMGQFKSRARAAVVFNFIRSHPSHEYYIFIVKCTNFNRHFDLYRTWSLIIVEVRAKLLQPFFIK